MCHEYTDVHLSEKKGRGYLVNDMMYRRNTEEMMLDDESIVLYVPFKSVSEDIDELICWPARSHHKCYRSCCTKGYEQFPCKTEVICPLVVRGDVVALDHRLMIESLINGDGKKRLGMFLTYRK